MDNLYRHGIISNDQINRETTSYFKQHNNNMNLNFRPQQISTAGILRRSQQINPEFSEPFDLDSEYIQREAPTPSRSSKTQDEFRKRQQPYSRPNESVLVTRKSSGQRPFQTQIMSQFYLPTFEPKCPYETPNTKYPINITDNYQNNRTEFNSSVFNADKKNNFVAVNKNEDLKKTLVLNSPQSKHIRISSSKRRCYFIGSVDQVIRWFRLAKQANIYAIFEISAILESVHPGKSFDKYVLFLRNENGFNSSILQAVFFCIDRNLPKLQTGQLITCVGRMIGANKLHVLDIWHNTIEEQAGIKRVSFLCQRTIQEATLSSSDSQ